MINFQILQKFGSIIMIVLTLCDDAQKAIKIKNELSTRFEMNGLKFMVGKRVGKFVVFLTEDTSDELLNRVYFQAQILDSIIP